MFERETKKRPLFHKKRIIIFNLNRLKKSNYPQNEKYQALVGKSNQKRNFLAEKRPFLLEKSLKRNRVGSPSAFIKGSKAQFFERFVDSELLQKGGSKWGVGRMSI